MGLIGQEQALDQLAAEEVALDQLGDVVDRDVAVPDLLGADDDGDALLALVEAAGVVGADTVVEAAGLEGLLEGVADVAAALGLAAAAGVVGGALVDAHEDVAGEARHRRSPR
ncbi:MAG: hypothetical protein HS111_20420 [Kofleriaceae bacterium]|nr:hypothetical protein [Kofleriaceae bacterium]